MRIFYGSFSRIIWAINEEFLNIFSRTISAITWDFFQGPFRLYMRNFFNYLFSGIKVRFIKKYFFQRSSGLWIRIFLTYFSKIILAINEIFLIFSKDHLTYKWGIFIFCFQWPNMSCMEICKNFLSSIIPAIN